MSKKPYCTKNIKGVDFDIYVSKIKFDKNKIYILPEEITEVIFRPKQNNTPDFHTGFIYGEKLSKKELNKAINDKLELVYMAYTEYSNNKK